MNMVRSLMSKNDLLKESWPKVVNWSVHILNRSPTSPLPNMTPREAWTRHRPAVDYFRSFGCIASAHVPNQKRSKLDDKGEKCIFLGVSDQSKAYRLYNPLTKKISVDFKNGEDLTMQNLEGQTQQTKGLTSADLEVSRQTTKESMPAKVELNTGESLSTTQELESRTSSQPQCKKRRPAWLEDYEVTNLPQDDVPVIHFALFANCDPLTYEEAIKEEKWQKAMEEEIGYKQEFGIDYQEVFAPVARMDTIRLVIALAAQNSWPIYQLDAKSAFLHRDLQEQEVSNKFQMKNCNSVTTPVDKGVKLVKDPRGRSMNSKLYKQIVGSLMYMAVTRLDIMHGRLLAYHWSLPPPRKAITSPHNSCNMVDKYGPIFTIKLGAYKALIVSDQQIAKECLTTNDKAFANRPKIVATEVIAYNNAMFGFAPYGPF
ncbi:hypothetical protein SLEP1_g16856 [Rubroshorea leprosula]|uniref:Reverse transcriptase Ty1/copia-type domain-containing protein n=1 Tax=Rubroshorea leprosula TaxID=152421 RepID=A0AAV5IZU3_9ROSI|nr:hypothetical protein SLEP1_g16856 [Rubroshorea leprosula]